MQLWRSGGSLDSDQTSGEKPADLNEPRVQDLREGGSYRWETFQNETLSSEPVARMM